MRKIKHCEYCYTTEKENLTTDYYPPDEYGTSSGPCNRVRCWDCKKILSFLFLRDENTYETNQDVYNWATEVVIYGPEGIESLDVALEYLDRLEKHNPEEMEKLHDRQYLRRTKRNY